MTHIKPRPYQIEAVDALYTFFSSHSDPKENPLIAMPTGTGKSVVIAMFIKSIFERWPDQRVLMLTHVKELIEQNAKKMREFWPGAPLGIYSAGLGEKVPNMPITFAGIQSARRAPERFGKVDLVIIDEAHLVSPDESAGYAKTLKVLRDRNPYLRIIGLSATIYRLGLGMLTEGGIFTDVAYDVCTRRAFVNLLDEGYLCPLVPIQTQMQLDVSKVNKRGGEFIESELQRAVVRYDLTKAALEETARRASDRHSWLIFATGIEHVEMIHGILEDMGIPSTYVHSKMDGKTRDENLRRYKRGDVKVMINANILTTGFDHPELDCIVSLRPTSSPVLHVQSLGRGTRPVYSRDFDVETTEGRLAAIAASKKQNCLVLDFAGNTRRLGPINDPKIPGRKGKNEEPGDMPMKVCPNCDCLNHISARVCDNCGTEFTFKEKITPLASTLDLIVRDEPVMEWFKVSHVTYAVHSKPGKPASLKVTYHCGQLRSFSEWVCLEHYGNPIQNKARQWWTDRARGTVLQSYPIPRTIEEAMRNADKLKTPTQIRVHLNKKYPSIEGVRFEAPQMTLPTQFA